MNEIDVPVEEVILMPARLWKMDFPDILVYKLILVYFNLIRVNEPLIRVADEFILEPMI